MVLVDLDHGDIAAKRDHLIRHIGPATMEVASGGVTPEGQRKLHLYWRLTEPAEGDDITTVCRVRHIIATKVGGDPSFRSAHQPIRVAGTIHAKNGCRRLVEILSTGPIERDLGELVEAVLAMPPLDGEGSSWLDFNDAGTARGSVTDLFSQQIREGGMDGTTRFEALSRVMGYWIRRCREGHITPADAWDEIVAYNEARIDPPWPVDRLQREAERLWERDQRHGAAHDGPDPADADEDGGWSVLASETHTAADNNTIRKSYRYPVAAGRYEVRSRRLDNKDTDARAGHEVRWGALRAILTDRPDFGAVTLLAVKMRATDNLSQRSSRLINVIVTRKLPVWSEAGGWTAPQPTRSIAWAFADACKAEYGAKLADSRIDLKALAVLDAVWASRGDTFDAVFDSSMTAWEAFTRIARCGRAIPIQQAGIVRIIRDAPQVMPVAMFGPRNIVKGSFKIKYIMPGDNTADAVTVEYFSSRTWKPDEVTAKLADSSGDNPAKVNLFGCTAKDHALREGAYIAANNRYRRRMVTFRTELEGMIPTYGDLIAVTHDMPRWGQGGEVIDWRAESSRPPWTGVIVTLSEPLVWTEGASHYLALRRRDGSLAGPFRVEAITDAPTLVRLTEPLTVTPYTGGYEERTYFSFGPGQAWAQSARILAIRPRAEQVEITAVAEDARVHVN